MDNLIPQPLSVTPSKGMYTLEPGAAIRVSPGTDELLKLGNTLGERLRRASGYVLPVQAASGSGPKGSLYLNITRLDASLGEEGYELRVESDRMALTALKPVGLFRGIQTILQLFPASIESPARQAGPWQAAAGVIRDRPRFAWRGAMLDVARHFYKPEQVKRFIDLMAAYKLNVLHLHLTDDQGWRLMINAWPDLARIGGSTAINGDPGGYYTQAEYRELVAYARSRFITLVPEVDMPGHTNAALASYPQLNPSGKAPALFTGNQVGFSSLDIGNQTTYRFLEEVVREIAALTPGPYFHIGGDEVHSTPEADYLLFIGRIQKIVQKLGKRCIGWEEVARGDLLSDTLVQHWANGELALKAAAKGHQVIMSPATKTYMDIKYSAVTHLGQEWTGSFTEIQDAYDWDPCNFLPGLPAEAVLGIEAPVWTETLGNLDDLDYMVFPRLCGYAEIGWTPQEKRAWTDYRHRLAGHGPRLAAMDVNFYRSPQVAWK